MRNSENPVPATSEQTLPRTPVNRDMPQPPASPPSRKRHQASCGGEISPGPWARTTYTGRRPGGRLRLCTLLPCKGPDRTHRAPPFLYPVVFRDPNPRTGKRLFGCHTLGAPVPLPSAPQARFSALVPPCLPTALCSSLATSRVAFGCKARESLRADAVHKPLLGAIPKYTSLPLPGFLVAMLTVCQHPKLSAGFGI